MTIGDIIMVFLGGYSESYRTARRALTGFPRQVPLSHLRAPTRCSSNTLKVTLSRLKKRGLVQNDEGKWGLTAKGKRHLQQWLGKKWDIRKSHRKPLKGTTHQEKNMIIAFDIPEAERWKRGWLRGELITLGFVPLQRSVWFGPAPLPKDFIKDLGELNLIRFLKFFKAATYDIV